MATTTSLSFHIFARYHGSPAFARARRDMRATNDQFHQGVVRAQLLQRAFANLTTAVISLTPALIPLTAALLAVSGGFIAITAAATAAGGIWAAVLISATAKSKEWDAAVGKLRSTWDAFVQRMAPAVLTPALVVVDTLRLSIGKLEPVVRAVTPVANEVAYAFRGWTTNGGLDRFINLLVQFGVPALRSFKNIAINLLAVLGEGFRAFLPTGLSVVQALERGSAALRAWAEGGGFQRFLAYVRENGPMVREFFSQLGPAIMRLMQAAMQAAPFCLILATALLRIINAIPIPVLTALIQLFIIWKTVLMGLFIVQVIANMFLFFKKAIMAVRVAWFILSIAFTSTPLGWLVLAIGALVAAIVFLATRTRFFQNVWRIAWAGIRAVGRAVWAALRGIFNAMRTFLTAGLPAAARFFGRVFSAAWRGIQVVARVVWNFLRNVVFGPFRNMLSKLLPAAGRVFRTVVGGAFSGVKKAVETAWNVIRNVVGKIIGALKKVKDAIGKIGGGVIGKVGGFLGKLNPFANGGAVRGPGTGTSDSIFAKLSNGEHVWTAREVRSIGGHHNVAALRKRALKGFAEGGPVGAAGAPPAAPGTPAGGPAGAAAGAPSQPAVAQAKAATNEAITQILTPVANLFSKGIPAAAATMQTAVSQKMNMLKSQVAGSAKGTSDALTASWRVSSANVAGEFNKITASSRKSSNDVAAASNAMGSRVRGAWNSTRNGVTATHRALVGGVYNPTRTMYTRNVPNWSNSMRNGVVRAFSSMRDGVGRTWKGIQGATKNPVNWVIGNTYGNGIRRLWNAVSNVIFGAGKKQLPAIRKLATGGPVNGPGGPTGDKIPAMLSAGEHVITAREVAAMGGHRRIAQARSAALGGRPVRMMGRSHFAEGGGTGGSASELVRGNLTSYVAPKIENLRKAMAKTIGTGVPFKAMVSDAMNTKMQDILDKVMADDAEHMYNGFQPFRAWQAGDGRKVGFRGKTFNVRTRAMLQKAEKIAKKTFSILQGSYSSGVAASGGTHSGGGAVDLNPSNDSIVGAMRSSGFAAWARTRKEGFSPHIHGIAVGDPTVSGAAANQVRAFFAGRNGLANNGPDTYVPGGGGAGAARWGPLVQAILRELGQSPSHVGNVLKAIQKESGGNPRAVNRWDSNAKAGHPSGGLLQTIGPTFNAYAGKYKSLGMFNPKANIYAAIRYAMARYGKGWSARMARPGGYAMGGGVPFAGTFDNGGMLPKGLSMVNNATGKPERLLNADKAVGGELHIHGNVYVRSEREFREMVAEAYDDLKRRGRT